MARIVTAAHPRALANHVMPGRWDDARQPTPGELNATAVVAVGLEECSAKVRSGPTEDDPADLAVPVWAGVLPLSIRPGAAVVGAAASYIPARRAARIATACTPTDVRVWHFRG